MYFAKNEVIELNNQKKYLVLDTAVSEDSVYYKVIEVNAEETKRVGEEFYITTVNKNGKIYINNQLTEEESKKIKELFED